MTLCMAAADKRDLKESHLHHREQVRLFCAGLPGVVEEKSLHQISFKVGHRPFVVIETFKSGTGDTYNCLAFKASFFDHEKLSSEPEYFPAPYLGGAGWLGCRLDDSTESPDIDQLLSALTRSHRQIAGGLSGSARRNRTRDLPV